MFKRVVPQPPARVLEFPSAAPAFPPRLTIERNGERALTDNLASLRAEMDGLTIKLAREHGRSSQAAVRAEQIAHAIQRLEWALERNDPPPDVS
ncbi:MAG TPA: hypothetical protein VHZ55_22025 [Bryobacteraceae bacterium]|nr:hypothetical protein [Bryobacteraceae bacterium]